MKKTLVITAIVIVALIGLGIWYWNVTVEIGTETETPKTAGSAIPSSPLPPQTGTASKDVPATIPATNTGASAPKTPVTPPTTAPIEAAVPKEEKVAVSIAKFQFTPSPLTIRKGTTVVWTNKDDATHTVSSDSGLFSSGSIIKGNSYSFTFEKTGTFPYICGFHPGMRGIIEVTE